jgi:CheY-like chemotaxis protein
MRQAVESQARILFMERDLSSRELVERILYDREVISVMQGSLGLELARAHRPDLILLDVHLPDIPGEAVLRRLREQPGTAELPVVALSDETSPDQERGLVAGGATACLTKPIDVRKMRRTVDEALTRRPVET